METSLDPADWDALRRLGRRMVDDMLTHLETIREQPAWRPLSDAARAALTGPPPSAPGDPARVYAEFLEHVLPYALGNTHPRFWGLVCGTGTPFAMLADLLAAGMNTNVFGGEQSAVYVEAQVIQWLSAMLGLPAMSGVLVSGASVANLVGLAVARDARSGIDQAGHGLARAAELPMLYCSDQTHNCVTKAVRLLGLGHGAIRTLPTRPDYTLDPAALAAAIRADRADGRRPFCIVANAGTVNTGACDDLERIADIAAEHEVWLHVDGAFGALAAISPHLRPRVAGLARADSVALDLHKWLYMPYAVGCTLVRDADAHRAAFQVPGAYLDRESRGVMANPLAFADLGPELSRGFRALKVWMSIKEHGVDRFARQIEQNVDQAAYLADLITAAPDLELMAPVALNIVCFRAIVPGLDEARLDAANREILLRLQERGIAVPTGTTLRGRYVMRVAITNHRSRREDFALLVDAVRAMIPDLET